MYNVARTTYTSYFRKQEAEKDGTPDKVWERATGNEHFGQHVAKHTIQAEANTLKFGRLESEAPRVLSAHIE